MLKAHLHRKLGRLHLEETVDADDLALRFEDPLTATIFERLLYLPPDLAHAIIASASDATDDAALFTEAYPRAARFWPRLPDATGALRVEPDVVIEHDRHLVVVEAKWHAPHNADQWVAEVEALDRADPTTRPIHLVVVSRGDRTPWHATGWRDPKIDPCRGRVRRAWIGWDRLAASIQVAVRGNVEPWVGAVLVDLLDALAARGLRGRLALGSLPPTPIVCTVASLRAAWRIG